MGDGITGPRDGITVLGPAAFENCTITPDPYPDQIGDIITLPPEQFVVREINGDGTFEMDVLQDDGTYKRVKPETIWEEVIDGPIAIHFVDGKMD